MPEKETVTRWVTINEAAADLSVNPKTIRRRIEDGSIEAKRIGPRLIRVNLASLDGFGDKLIVRNAVRSYEENAKWEQAARDAFGRVFPDGDLEITRDATSGLDDIMRLRFIPTKGSAAHISLITRELYESSELLGYFEEQRAERVGGHD